MKTMVSILGTALLVTGVAFAQTAASSSGTSSKKTATTASSPHSSTSSKNDPNAATDPSASTVKAGNSGFDAGLPQSDSSGSSSASAQSGSYGASGQAGSSPSAPQTTSGAGSYPTQSASSDEITNGPVAETVSDSSATIGWSTRSAGTGTSVKYGSNRANLSETAQAADGSDGKNHHAKLQGLSASTRYYFQITANGQPVGGVVTFKTTAAGETPVQSKAVIPQK